MKENNKNKSQEKYSPIIDTPISNQIYFFFKERNGKLRWKDIIRLDIEEMIKSNDISPLETYLENLIFSKIDQNELEIITEETTEKLIKIYQHIIEYLIYKQSKLEKGNKILEDTFKNFMFDHEKILKQNRLFKEQICQKEKNLNFYNTIKDYHTSCISSPEPYSERKLFFCGFCSGKRFSSEENLKKHFQRRHQNQPKIEKDTNINSQLESLVQSIKNLENFNKEKDINLIEEKLKTTEGVIKELFHNNFSHNNCSYERKEEIFPNENARIDNFEFFNLIDMIKRDQKEKFDFTNKLIQDMKKEILDNVQGDQKEKFDFTNKVIQDMKIEILDNVQGDEKKNDFTNKLTQYIKIEILDNVQGDQKENPKEIEGSQKEIDNVKRIEKNPEEIKKEILIFEFDKNKFENYSLEEHYNEIMEKFKNNFDKRNKEFEKANIDFGKLNFKKEEIDRLDIYKKILSKSQERKDEKISKKKFNGKINEYIKSIFKIKDLNYKNIGEKKLEELINLIDKSLCYINLQKKLPVENETNNQQSLLKKLYSDNYKILKKKFNLKEEYNFMIDNISSFRTNENLICNFREILKSEESNCQKND